jgi:hypothetical protein
MARHLWRPEWKCWDAPAALPLARGRPAEAAIARALAGAPGVRTFSPSGRLCTDESCVTVLRRRLLYFDDDHLSATGARMLVPGWLDEAFMPPARTPAPPSSVPPTPRR